MKKKEVALIAGLGVVGASLYYYFRLRKPKKAPTIKVEVSQDLVDYIPRVRSFLKSTFGKDAELKSLIEYVEGTPQEVTEVEIKKESLVAAPASVEIKFTIDSEEYVIAMPKYFFLKLMREERPKEYFFQILLPRIRPRCKIPI